MRKTKVLCAVLACVMLLFSLAACGKQNELVGKWENNGHVWGTFYDNGKCQISVDGGGFSSWGEQTYVVDGQNNLQITDVYGKALYLEYVEPNQVEEYMQTHTSSSDTPCWSIDGDTLYIGAYKLTRQK